MSWTAEIIYSLLLYRAQLSKKNRWIDSEGRIYIQFSNASLAKALHKCEASVRNALRELEKAGLIEKRSNAGSANTIYEIYKRGLSNEALAAEIRAHGLDHVGEPRKNPITGAETAPEQVIYCDCAEPKSVHDLREYGLRARPCIKRPGCVNYRIKWLQKRTLVVDPRRTPNVYREFSQYEYDADKDGNFLPSVPDRDNHTIDAAAYALTILIFNPREGA